VLKFGRDAHVDEHRVLLRDQSLEVTLPGARWFFPNGGATGFYRFTIDDVSLQALVASLQDALAPHERLLLVDNQWALLKAGTVSIEQFLTMLDGYRTEADRAVLSAITDHLGWLSTHVVSDAERPAFERFVGAHYRPLFDALGWDPQPNELADERLKRAVVMGAVGSIARDPAVRAEARRRLERYFTDRTSLDPNLVSIVVALAARDGDAALYERYLERKRAAATDPEEEQRFLIALSAFEVPNLIERTLHLAISGDVRAQDRTFLLGSLLGRRVTRAAAWEFVHGRWDALAKLMDPMLLQNLIRALGQLTYEPVATRVRDFLAPHATDETRETIAQVTEHLRIDAATVTRLQPALAAALRKRA